MVSNNGTLSEALVRSDGCITSRSDTHRAHQLVVGHRLVQGHLEATIVGGGELLAFLLLVGTTHPCSLRSLSPPTPLRRLRCVGGVLLLSHAVNGGGGPNNRRHLEAGVAETTEYVNRLEGT